MCVKFRIYALQHTCKKYNILLNHFTIYRKLSILNKILTTIMINGSLKKESFCGIRLRVAFLIAVSSSYWRGVFRSYRSAILRGRWFVRRREKACRAICDDDEVLAARCKLDMYAHTLLYTRMYISLYLYVNTWRQQRRQKRGLARDCSH